MRPNSIIKSGHSKYDPNKFFFYQFGGIVRVR